jgi:hypothetical protein
MFDKVDELETIMLGEDKDDPKLAWLKKKFAALRNDYPAQQYVQRTALAAGVAGVLIGSSVSLIVHHLLFGCR